MSKCVLLFLAPFDQQSYYEARQPLGGSELHLHGARSVLFTLLLLPDRHLGSFQVPMLRKAAGDTRTSLCRLL